MRFRFDFGIALSRQPHTIHAVINKYQARITIV